MNEKLLAQIRIQLQNSETEEAIKNIKKLEVDDIEGAVLGVSKNYIFDIAVYNDNLDAANAIIEKYAELKTEEHQTKLKTEKYQAELNAFKRYLSPKQPKSDYSTRLKPLEFNYSADDLIEFNSYSSNRFISQSSLIGYTTLLSNEKQKYTQNIFELSKELQIHGLEMLSEVVTNKSDKNALAAILKSYKHSTSPQLNPLTTQYDQIIQNVSKETKSNSVTFKKATAILETANFIDKSTKEFYEGNLSLREFKKQTTDEIQKNKQVFGTERKGLKVILKKIADAINSAFPSKPNKAVYGSIQGNKNMIFSEKTRTKKKTKRMQEIIETPTKSSNVKGRKP